jgi:tRNA1(Val) A37 N6-methylase TrmN6
MQSEIDIMKMVLAGMRQELILAQEDNNSEDGYYIFLERVENYMECMRKARKFGITVKEICNFHRQIDLSARVGEKIVFKCEISSDLIFKN